MDWADKKANELYALWQERRSGWIDTNIYLEDGELSEFAQALRDAYNKGWKEALDQA
jgi:hypothetical protein